MTVTSSSNRPPVLEPTVKRIVEPVIHSRSEEPPTRNELWRWCLRADAVAQCYIRDVVALRESDKDPGRDQDAFWWLGTVPCRSVRFVGILVGAIAYEKRTVYTVDDGTGAIQCVHLRSGASNDKRKFKKTNSTPSSSPRDEIPKPLCEVGEVVRVSGRVSKWNDIFQIIVNDIEFCRPNEEPDHWIATAKLHETYYTQPFVIPPLPILPPSLPKTPVKPSSIVSAPKTPHTTSSVATPSTTASMSSPTVPPGGLVRLRHPSRLRSKELISSTFKIYLKNYMDVLSDPSQVIPFSQPQSDDYPSTSSVMESPTKKLKRIHNAEELEFSTPKPNRRSRPWQEEDDTPRPSAREGKENVTQPGLPRRSKGFTLSYLRRVPELAAMALRVVDAETKRRAREARRKQKEAAKSQKAIEPKPIKTETRSKKAKRLYTWAIRELHKEGSIILHEDDAPVWEAFDTRDVWKLPRTVDQSVDADGTTSTFFSNLTGGTLGDGVSLVEDRSVEDSGELSEPPEHEESYLSLTPALMTEPILEAIKSMRMRKPAPRPGTGQQAASYRHISSRAIGPTSEELHEYMGKTDARWENVSEYVVADALQLLKGQDRVYKVGNGRWEITL